MPLPTDAVAASPLTGSVQTSAQGKPIGPDVGAFRGAQPPSRSESLVGQYVKLVPLDPTTHSADLVETIWKPTDEGHFTYLPYSHPDTKEEFERWLESHASNPALHPYAILASPVQRGETSNKDNKPQAVGTVSLMRLDTTSGSIEIGHVLFSPLLQRTRTASEAIFLLLQLAFDQLGYERVEWKADNLNEPSKRAAKRFGFTFEGVFRRHVVYKHHWRDTAWFALVRPDWPLVKQSFERWLDASNFDAHGQQLRDLKAIRQQLAQ